MEQYIDLVKFSPRRVIGSLTHFLLIMDDFSRLMWVAMLKCKSEAFGQFKKFKALAEVEKNMKLKCLHSNRGICSCGQFESIRTLIAIAA
ncbi:unnamed protein product [Spirodela intermedia]|uniref:Uncharacterized protein n=1 Tax=Spirodela intermedia TaxID=51605 RepID=A0A7I8IH24_SPIIN|nr:unnamed protein product [Spirodela intermedia]CAA6657179.1 unnamed protein product [Spirodela intermedia]